MLQSCCVEQKLLEVARLQLEDLRSARSAESMHHDRRSSVPKWKSRMAVLVLYPAS